VLLLIKINTMKPIFALIKPGCLNHMYTMSVIAVPFILFTTASILDTVLPDKNSQPPKVIVVNGGESERRPEDCLKTLVGPGINQTDSFHRWDGFVGWVSPVRLGNGDWLVGFSAGYWHTSPPTLLRYILEADEL